MLDVEEVVNLKSRWKRLTAEPDVVVPVSGYSTINDKVLEESIWLQPGQAIREKIDVQASCEQMGAACNVPLKPGKYRLLYNSPYSFVSYFEIVEPTVKEIDYLRLDEQHLSLAEAGYRIFSDRYLMFGCVTFEGSDYIILSMKPGYSGDRPAFKAGTPLNAELVPTYQPYFRVTKGTGPIVGIQASASRDEKVTLRWRDDAGEHMQVLVPPYAAYGTGAN